MKIDSNETEVSIKIQDDGPGFPDDILEFIGEPYIKSKTTSNKSGLGLGTFLGKPY